MNDWSSSADALLSFIIADELFKRFPQASEGQLSRLRANLVKGETLAVIAKAMSLGESLNLGSGELKTGGFRRASILAGAMEALIGAVYRDGGMKACRRIVLAVYKDRLAHISPTQNLKDPKTRLQEFLQARVMAHSNLSGKIGGWRSAHADLSRGVPVRRWRHNPGGGQYPAQGRTGCRAKGP